MAALLSTRARADLSGRGLVNIVFFYVGGGKISSVPCFYCVTCIDILLKWMTMLSVVAMVYCALNKCNVIRNSGGATNVAYDLVCCHCGSAYIIQTQYWLLFTKIYYDREAHKYTIWLRVLQIIISCLSSCHCMRLLQPFIIICHLLLRAQHLM